MRNSQPEQKKRRGDLFLAGGILLAALVLGMFFCFRKSIGAEVVVYVDGVEWARYALSDDVCVTIGEGEQFNVLEISDGYARITAASCPDKLCQKQGKIHTSGEMIVCLPNKVVVEISGGSAETDVTIG